MAPRPAGYYIARAWQYQADVLAGRIPACRWVRLACARNARDLKRARKKTAEILFDPIAAERVCGTVEQFPHIKGPKAKQLRVWTGAQWVWRWQTLELEPWQCWILAVFFGWLRRPSGLRRFRTALILVPRKNAKSTMTAGVGLYMLTADGESGAEVYSAATKRDQARIVFGVAKEMARRCPDFKAYFGLLVEAQALTVDTTASKFEALSSDANSLDGLNPNAALVDELHAHRTRAVWDVLETAMGSREQPVLWAISTAGTTIGGICYELWTYAQKVLDGLHQDDSFFAINYTVDDGDDWKSEATWRKANPNFAVSVSPEYLRDKARRAEHSPAAVANFLTKHLNVWTTAASPWMSMPAWQACATPGLTWESLAGAERCVVAVDLAEKRDVASMVAVAAMPDGTVRAVAKHFLPETAIEASPVAQMSGWVREGHLVATSGDVQDYARLEEEIVAIYDRVQATEVCFDRALAAHLMQDLQERIGHDVVIEVPQNVKTFNPAMVELDGRVTARTFQHSGDPVLAWMISNVAARKNHMEELYPQKAGGKDSPNKIDGAVALFMGVSRLLLTPAESSFDGLVMA